MAPCLTDFLKLKSRFPRNYSKKNGFGPPFRPNTNELLENTRALAQIWDLYGDLKNKQYAPSLSIDFEEWRDCKK